MLAKLAPDHTGIDCTPHASWAAFPDVIIIWYTCNLTTSEISEVVSIVYPNILGHGQVITPVTHVTWSVVYIIYCVFVNENVWISIKISMKFVPNDPINNSPALVQIMACRRPGNKPLSEPVMAEFTDAYMRTRPLWINRQNSQQGLRLSEHSPLRVLERSCIDSNDQIPTRNWSNWIPTYRC